MSHGVPKYLKRKYYYYILQKVGAAKEKSTMRDQDQGKVQKLIRYARKKDQNRRINAQSRLWKNNVDRCNKILKKKEEEIAR